MKLEINRLIGNLTRAVERLQYERLCGVSDTAERKAVTQKQVAIHKLKQYIRRSSNNVMGRRK